MSVNTIRFAFLAALLVATVFVFACVDVSNYLEGGGDSDDACVYPGGASALMDEKDYELDAEECEVLGVEISVDKIMTSADMMTFLVEGAYELPDEEDVYHIWHIGRKQSNCFVEIDGVTEEKTFSVWSRYIECPSKLIYKVVLETEAPTDDDDADDDANDDDADDDTDDDDDDDDDDNDDDDADDDDDDDDDDDAQWEPDVICSFTIDLLADCPEEESDDDDADDDDADDDAEEA